MPSDAPIARTILTAVVLAERAGASEITIPILLAALDHELTTSEIPETRGEPFLPAPQRDMRFSREAVAAIAPLGNIRNISTSELRSALRARKP